MDRLPGGLRRVLLECHGERLDLPHPSGRLPGGPSRRGCSDEVEAFTGRRGNRERFFQAARRFLRDHGHHEAREGFTVAVAWEKGLVAPPSVPLMERIKGGSRPQGPVMGCLAGLFLLYYAGAWLFKGRDPKKGLVIPLYEPPEGVEPGYVSTSGRGIFSRGPCRGHAAACGEGSDPLHGAGRRTVRSGHGQAQDRMDFTETLRRLCDSLTN